MDTKAPDWKPSRAQLAEVTCFVLGGMFVGLVGLRFPVIDVTIAGLILWVIAAGGVVAYNLIRAIRRN